MSMSNTTSTPVRATAEPKEVFLPHFKGVCRVSHLDGRQVSRQPDTDRIFMSKVGGGTGGNVTFSLQNLETTARAIVLFNPDETNGFDKILEVQPGETKSVTIKKDRLDKNHVVLSKFAGVAWYNVYLVDDAATEIKENETCTLVWMKHDASTSLPGFKCVCRVAHLNGAKLSGNGEGDRITTTESTDAGNNITIEVDNQSGGARAVVLFDPGADNGWNKIIEVQAGQKKSAVIKPEDLRKSHFVLSKFAGVAWYNIYHVQDAAAGFKAGNKYSLKWT
ncbi:MAG: hypothetical protein R3B70_11170 [Polyangiaceae bacterium]